MYALHSTSVRNDELSGVGLVILFDLRRFSNDLKARAELCFILLVIEPSDTSRAISINDSLSDLDRHEGTILSALAYDLTNDFFLATNLMGVRVVVGNTLGQAGCD